MEARPAGPLSGLHGRGKAWAALLGAALGWWFVPVGRRLARAHPSVLRLSSVATGKTELLFDPERGSAAPGGWSERAIDLHGRIDRASAAWSASRCIATGGRTWRLNAAWSSTLDARKRRMATRHFRPSSFRRPRWRAADVVFFGGRFLLLRLDEALPPLLEQGRRCMLIVRSSLMVHSVLFRRTGSLVGKQKVVQPGGRNRATCPCLKSEARA